MSKQKFLSILSLCLLMNCAVGQKTTHSFITKKTAIGKAKKHFDKGMEYNRQSQNEKAAKEFEKALEAAPRFIDAQIQWAAMHYDMGHFAKAEMGFEKAIAIDSTYNKKLCYVVGIAEMKQEKYAEAIGHFDQYLLLEKKNQILLRKAAKYRATSQFTLEAVANPVPFNPVNLGDKINTTDGEYLPSITADESVLVYTKRMGGQEDFYLSKKVNGEWQAGKPLDDINTELNEGAQNISVDGKLLVFTACDRRDGYGSCDLYFSEVVNGRWTKVANMGNVINSRQKETQPSLSADGKALFFASNRSGGQGDMDIWVSHRNEKGEWQLPVNLGDTINSPGIDRAPFIHPDGQTLYFMSDGHKGMGGSDLFYARKNDDGSWGKPQNLGYPINSEADEGTLVISLDGKTAYFATDRNKTDQQTNATDLVDMDLYSFELYPEARPQPVTYVRAKVRDAATKKKLAGAKVEFTDLATAQTHAFSTTDPDGEFLVCLPLGKNYSLNVTKDQYIFHSENFALHQTNSLDRPFILDIDLQPIPIVAISEGPTNPGTAVEGKPIVLKNVFFETGSAELKQTSLLELNRLRNLLSENPGLHIRINGHTDNVGTDEDNNILSNNRAKAVYDFLIVNGISSERLQYKGFGESQPIATNDTPEGRQLNRRTEFVVIK